MNLSALKTLTLGFFTAAVLSSTAAFAASPQEEKIEVTPVSKVSQEELAAIYVLSEVCPALVDQPQKFEAGYAKLAKEYLPQEQNPVSALKTLSKQKNFQSVLKEAQSDAKKAGTAKNREICKELTTYSK